MTGLFTVGGIAAFCVFFAKSPALAIRSIITLAGFACLAFGGFLYAFSSIDGIGTPYLLGGFGLLAFISWTGKN